MRRETTRWAAGLLGLSLLATGGCSGEGPEGVVPGVEALVFAKRNFVRPDGSHAVNSGVRQAFDYQRYVPGGGVFVLSPPTPDGDLLELTADFEEVDINGLDLSFDAKQVVFSMRHAGTDNYHIYVANIDGSEVRQLTFGPYNDVKPVWLPGDRIAFVTNEPYTEMGTRANEYEHQRDVTQLGTISAQVGDADRRLCAQNLSHTADPFLMSDGRVGFSQWEHLGPVNDVKLRAVNPDCTGEIALAGQHGKPGNSIVQVREVEQGVFYAVVMPRSGTMQGGSLVRIEVPTSSIGSGVFYDEQRARFDLLTPEVPTGGASPPSGAGRYRRPTALPGSEQLLVSWSDGDVNGRNQLAGIAPDFGIYLFDPQTRERRLVYNDPTSWDVYALPVVPREEPPVRGGTVDEEEQGAILGSVDVTQTSLEERVRTLDNGPLAGLSLAEALQYAHRVRIIEGFSSEIGPVRRFGLTAHEGAAIVGEARVLDDGSWEARVPAMLPYHLQPLDRFGMSIRNQLLWIRAHKGEQRRCGGCHAPRTEQVLPRRGPTTLAQQAGAEDFLKPVEERLELPWIGSTTARNIQDLFDDKCVSCHDGGPSDPFRDRTYTVAFESQDGEMLGEVEMPYLRLTSEPAPIYQMDSAERYPMSYTTLMLAAGMMGESRGDVMGDAPPVFIYPGAARQSLLVRKLNVNAEDDPNEWAWSDMPHPEDVGVTLTREERMMLVRMADLGAQFWSRRNIDVVDEWGRRYE